MLILFVINYIFENSSEINTGIQFFFKILYFIVVKERLVKFSSVASSKHRVRRCWAPTVRMNAFLASG